MDNPTRSVIMLECLRTALAISTHNAVYRNTARLVYMLVFFNNTFTEEESAITVKVM